MVFHNSFDISEFLAYLLPGSLILLIIHFFFGETLSTILHSQLPFLMSASGVVGLVSYLAAALAAGHIASIWTRWITRPFSRRLNGNARQIPFSSATDQFYSEDLKKAIRDKFTEAFGLQATDNEAAPRLVRSFVLARSLSTQAAREQIARARSLCGNLTLPTLLMIGIFAAKGYYFLAILSAAAFAAMIYKQADLDEREWKEIYTAFVSLPIHVKHSVS